MARHPRWLRGFASHADLDAVADAVAHAERGTAAEIRVHLDHRCAGDAMARAIEIFERLRMHQTAERAGVLLYLAVGDRKVAVIGDTGIHQRVGQGYWDELVARVIEHLREGRPREGLVGAVAALGAALSTHFPRRRDDRNELSDRVSLEDGGG
jgi:uncharacterized membrane protein